VCYREQVKGPFPLELFHFAFGGKTRVHYYTYKAREYRLEDRLGEKAMKHGKSWNI
jgi:hypothetical protein